MTTIIIYDIFKLYMINIINLCTLIIPYNKHIYCAYSNKIYKTIQPKRLYSSMTLGFHTSILSLQQQIPLYKIYYRKCKYI